MGVSDGQVGFRNAGVVCVDARNGRTVWRAPLPHDINSTVCSDGRAVYALDGQGSVYALDVETGAERWRRDVYAATDLHETSRFGWRTFLGPLTVSDGRVLVTGSRILAGLDAATGEPVWTNYNDLNAHAPYPVSGLAPRAGLGYFEDESKVFALRLDTGDVTWVRQLKELSGETSRERGTSTPLVTEEGVYFHHRSHLRKLDPQTGEERWTVRTGEGFNYVSAPAWAEGKVVVATGARIVAVNAVAGDIAWTFGTRHVDATDLGKYQNLLNGSAPAIANGCVFVGGDDGFLYALRLDDGVKVWEYDTGTPIKASPALSGNLLVISNFAGQLFAFVPE